MLETKTQQSSAWLTMAHHAAKMQTHRPLLPCFLSLLLQELPDYSLGLIQV